ncbi:MAG TPA: NAD(P)H-dependent oxidoreductase [Gemmatimonadota bacterium]|nr:NAD(P)H-dependent oxidoreductase [Gemmatimonadota bacterium]
MPDKRNGLIVAAFAGSLRAASYNRALLRAAVESVPSGMTIEILDISGIPLYDADVEEAGVPEPVAAFKRAIGAADGLLIATPEYNHGVAGITKNAVDWASRPPRGSPLSGKPVGIMGASPGMTGTARGQSQLRQAFEFTNSYCMPQPEILVARAGEKFDADGRLTDGPTREHLARYLAAFAAWIEVFRAPRS